jgi:hypothetical protein
MEDTFKKMIYTHTTFMFFYKSPEVCHHPRMRSSLHRRPSRTSSKGSPSWIAISLLLVLPIFVILSLFNLGIALLRLEDHKANNNNHAIEMATAFASSAALVDKFSSRPLLPPSIWSTRKLTDPIDISPLLSANETERAKDLCGKFIFSTLQRAVRAGEMAKEVFVGVYHLKGHVLCEEMRSP